MTKHSRPHPRAPCPALRSAMPVRCTPPPSRCCEAAGAERNSRLGAQRPIQTRPRAEAGAESAHCPPVPSLPAPRLTGGRGAGPDAWPQPHPSLWVHACCCSHCRLSGPGRGAPTALQPRGRSSRGLRACLWGTYSTVSASMSRCLSAGPAPLARTAGEQPQWTGPPGLRGPSPFPGVPTCPAPQPHLAHPVFPLEPFRRVCGTSTWNLTGTSLLTWKISPFIVCLPPRGSLRVCWRSVGLAFFFIRLSFYGFDALFVSQILVAHHICVMKTIFFLL